MKHKLQDFLDVLAEVRKIETSGNYYAKTYLDNIFPDIMDEMHVRMFCKGGGKELFPVEGKKEKAACIYSSSMLSYNFFHWINKYPVTLYGVKYNRVVFEEQFRVLKNRNNKANIDVVLVSEDGGTIMLIESKFTEHLEKGTVEIKDAYNHASNYFSYGNKWKEIMNYINEKKSDKNVYYEGLKQAACHLIGISSMITDDLARSWYNNNSWLSNQYGIELTGKENFIFKSVVFHPKTEKEGTLSGIYEKENKRFIKEKMDFLSEIISLENPIITYRELWNKGMRDSITDPKLGRYLERYLEAHI